MFAEFATAAGGQGRAPAISHRPSCAVSGLAAGGRGVTQRTFATFSHRFWMMNVDCWCRCLLASRALRSADGFNGDQFPNVNSSPVNVRLLAVA